MPKKLVTALEQSDDPALKEKAVIMRLRSKSWPPGHPWAPIALLLMAFQQFEIQNHWVFSRGIDAIFELVLLISCVMWLWTGIMAYRKASAAAKSVNK